MRGYEQVDSNRAVSRIHETESRDDNIPVRDDSRQLVDRTGLVVTSPVLVEVDSGGEWHRETVLSSQGVETLD